MSDGCEKCGGPPDKGRWLVGDGFICTTCGEGNPELLTDTSRDSLDRIIQGANRLIAKHGGSDAAAALRYVVRLAEEVKRRT